MNMTAESLESLKQNQAMIAGIRWEAHCGFVIVTGRVLDFRFDKNSLRINLDKNGCTFWCSVDEVYDNPCGAWIAIVTRNDEYFRSVVNELWENNQG